MLITRSGTPSSSPRTRAVSRGEGWKCEKLIRTIRATKQRRRFSIFSMTLRMTLRMTLKMTPVETGKVKTEQLSKRSPWIELDRAGLALI